MFNQDYSQNCSELQPLEEARALADVRSKAREGLSKAHISPRVAKATFWLGASLIKTDRGREPGQAAGGGIRGKIKVFSPASRRRLQYLVSSVRRDVPVYFVTLTYPDNFPADPAKWKRDVDTFRKRFKRKGWGAVWKIEFKQRKSGVNVGKVAPHFHLLVYGADYLDLFHWCANAWYDVVGSGDPKHRSAGTRVEYIKTVNGSRKYISKYVGKDEQDLDFECETIGRFWGVINRAAIPWGVALDVELEDAQANDLVRLLRRYARMKRRANLPSLTVMCNNADQWFDRLDRLLDRGKEVQAVPFIQRYASAKQNAQER